MRVIPYAEWCDVPFNRQPASMPIRQSDVWLHHGAAGTSSIRTARAYARHHNGKSGWAGLGYSWLIADGQVLEGRGPGRAGSHTQGHNSKSYGICMVGDYQRVPPSDKDVDALVSLLIHGRDSGWFTTSRLSGGHRDVGTTACPGDALYRLIPTINRKVDEQVTDMSNNQPPPTARNIDDDIRRIRISLRALGAALNVPVDLNGPADGTTIIT